MFISQNNLLVSIKMLSQVETASNSYDALIERAKASSRLGVVTTTEVITPEVASRLLEGMGKNRSLKQAKKNQYLSDMQQGRWSSTSLIRILDDGSLGDGQHRMMAVKALGRPVAFQVMTGMPRDEMYTIDTGAARNLYDVAQIAGIDTPAKGLSAIKLLLKYSGITRKSPYSLSNSDIFDVAKVIEDGILFVDNQRLSSREVLSAPVYAALILCYYNENHERLADFVRIITSGPKERAALIDKAAPATPALAFMDWYQKTVKGNGNSGDSISQERFDRTLNAARSFCARLDTSRIGSKKRPARYSIEQLKGLRCLQVKSDFKRFQTTHQACKNLWQKGLASVIKVAYDHLKPGVTYGIEDMKAIFQRQENSFRLSSIKIGVSEVALDEALSRVFIQRALDDGSLEYGESVDGKARYIAT